MERLAGEVLPKGMTYEWTELTYQQILAGNTALFVFPLCVLLAFLVLAAQYNSWLLPLAVLLIVPMCLLRAIAGCAWWAATTTCSSDRPGGAGRPGGEERDPDRRVRPHAGGRGRRALEAVVEACRLRLGRS